MHAQKIDLHHLLRAENIFKALYYEVRHLRKLDTY